MDDFMNKMGLKEIQIHPIIKQDLMVQMTSMSGSEGINLMTGDNVTDENCP